MITATASIPVLNDLIAEQARLWLKTPYIHRGINKRGCDCTGLLIGILQSLGHLQNFKLREYPPDWNLHAMASNYVVEEIGKIADEITSGDLCRGDLILFRFGRCVAHLGIYEGLNLFIHTHKNAGKAVYGYLDGQNEWSTHISNYFRLNEDKLKGFN